jgi:hypothetical protein
MNIGARGGGEKHSAAAAGAGITVAEDAKKSRPGPRRTARLSS